MHCDTRLVAMKCAMKQSKHLKLEEKKSRTATNCHTVLKDLQLGNKEF